MSSLSLFHIGIATGVLAAFCGCAPGPALTFSNVPNPVLLGPVERVGGARRPADSTGGFSVDIERGAYFASSKYSTTSRSWDDSPRKASFAALEATNARPDVDVRLEKVKAGAWFYYLVTSFWLSEWVETSGGTRKVAP